VYRYADEIFSLGRELQDTLKGRPPGRSLRLLVGVANTLPKEIAYRLLEPAMRLGKPVQLVCEHGMPDALLAQLAVNALDVVLADAPVSPTTKVRAFNHLLGECGVSLEGAPFLFPSENSALRRSLEQWFDAGGIRPQVRGEIADPGLLKVFGQKGVGVFAVRSAVERETQRHYRVRLVGRVESIRERFYAISVERKLKHPAVVAITAAAREKLFA
jgi:LysR family transcriptional activator of nhaA